MRGVRGVERFALQVQACEVLKDVECGTLEIIKADAFNEFTSLRSINLPSARSVENFAFAECTALTDVRFSSKLERIFSGAFDDCTFLERITIPLKDGMIREENTFLCCFNLNQVHLLMELYYMKLLPLCSWRIGEMIRVQKSLQSIKSFLMNVLKDGTMMIIMRHKTAD